jgi:hypothetical protein
VYRHGGRVNIWSGVEITSLEVSILGVASGRDIIDAFCQPGEDQNVKGNPDLHPLHNHGVIISVALRLRALVDLGRITSALIGEIINRGIFSSLLLSSMAEQGGLGC